MEKVRHISHGDISHGEIVEKKKKKKMLLKN